MKEFDQRIPIFLQLGFREDGLEALKDYVERLWEGNTHLNLISRKMTLQELIDNHLIDCLLPLKFLASPPEVVGDFGSGGGLPGVVYAIHFQKTRFRLYEKSKLKQDFLAHCKDFASNMDVLGEIPPQLGQIELVVSRAFKPINVLLDMSRSYQQKGGRYFLLKGRREKIDEELKLAEKQFKNLKIKIEKLHSPVLEVERNLVLIG